MGKFINKNMLIDQESGEVLNEKFWIGYDGFSDKGYRYRAKSVYIRYFFDSLPENYDYESLFLLFMISELMNEENMLVYRVKRKSKFSNIIYKPLDKEEIRQSLRFKYGINKFKRCWSKLTKYALKQIRYHDYICWAVNPAIFSKCKDVPFWLYEEFQDSMNPHLAASTVKKLQNKVRNLYYETNDDDQT